MRSNLQWVDPKPSNAPTLVDVAKRAALTIWSGIPKPNTSPVTAPWPMDSAPQNISHLHASWVLSSLESSVKKKKTSKQDEIQKKCFSHQIRDEEYRIPRSWKSVVGMLMSFQCSRNNIKSVLWSYECAAPFSLSVSSTRLCRYLSNAGVGPITTELLDEKQ